MFNYFKDIFFVIQYYVSRISLLFLFKTEASFQDLSAIYLVKCFILRNLLASPCSKYMHFLANLFLLKKYRLALFLSALKVKKLINANLNNTV